MQKKNAYNLKIQDLFQKYIELEKKYTVLQSQLKDISNPPEKYKTELCKKLQRDLKLNIISGMNSKKNM